MATEETMEEENGEETAPAEKSILPPETFPNISEEDQEVELEPVEVQPAAYASPDPATSELTMLPITDAIDEEGGEGAEARAEYEGMSSDDLVAEIEDRGIELPAGGGTGSGGNYVKGDYVRLLAEDDS